MSRASAARNTTTTTIIAKKYICCEVKCEEVATYHCETCGLYFCKPHGIGVGHDPYDGAHYKSAYGDRTNIPEPLRKQDKPAELRGHRVNIIR